MRLLVSGNIISGMSNCCICEWNKCKYIIIHSNRLALITAQTYTEREPDCDRRDKGQNQEGIS